MTLAEIIKGRRSTTQFLDMPVPDELVAGLLEIAIWAPNHHLTQPWRFVIVSGEGREGLAELHRRYAIEGAIRRQASPEQVEAAGEKEYHLTMRVPTYLAIVQKESPDLHVREEDFAACCCLAQNFMLLAWEQGVITHWLSFWHEERHCRFLGLAPDEKVVAFLRIGYPIRIPLARERIPARDRLTYIRDGVIGHVLLQESGGESS